MTSPDPTDLQDRYQRARLRLSEEMYGPGFQSSGGLAFLERVGPHLRLRPEDHLLDLGCGTGGTLRYFAQRYGCRGTGVDGSPDCLELAREENQRQGVSGFELVCSDFRRLALSRTYDALWTCQSLLYVSESEKEACLSHVAAHLKPGGRGLLVDYCRGTAEPSPAFREYCADCGFELPTVEGFAAVAERAGFGVVDVVDYTDDFTDAMVAEVEQLERKRADFLARYEPADFAGLHERWTSKIRFCRDGDLRAAYVIVEAPGAP